MPIRDFQKKFFLDPEKILQTHGHRKIVFTNGCFDILHLGHVRYLDQAACLGDLLVVGINSDESVRRLNKVGPPRPIHDLEARAEVLCALSFVTAVIPFEEDTPLELIKKIRPQVLVKGGDYDAKASSGEKYIVGATEVRSWGGVVQTISLVEGYSTTKLITGTSS